MKRIIEIKEKNLKLTRSKARVQNHGEVFTPPWVVNDMLNLLPKKVWDVSETFLEPACGDGVFLMEVYKRKLQNIEAQTLEEWEWQAAIATSSIYGIELLEDNAEQCTMNLIRIFIKHYELKSDDHQDEEVIKSIQFLLGRNIVQGNALTFRRCTESCENKCLKCELIILSEWKLLPNYHIERKDYTYEGIVNASNQRKASKGTLWEEESENAEFGLVKEFLPVSWKEIRHVEK